jgi:hypothetical protein
MQRVETLCFLLGLEHRPVQICSLQIVTMKAWSARRERHLAYKISPILGVGAADIDLCVEYDAQEYGNGVLNSLNWCEFQPRSLIGCYLEYAKLIDPAVSCFLSQGGCWPMAPGAFGLAPQPWSGRTAWRRGGWRRRKMRRVAILGQGADFAAA